MPFGQPEIEQTKSPLTQADLNVIIRKHIMFLNAKPGGARAVVRDRDLSGLTFLGQNLSQSDFTGSLLCGADLSNANFECATLFGCDLTNAKVENARLIRADLRGSDTSAVDLSKADTTGADLRAGKTLSTAKKKIEVSNFVLTAPSEDTSTDTSSLILTGEAISPPIDSDLLLQGAAPEKLENIDIPLTLDEQILLHQQWLSSGGRQGKQLKINGTDMRKGPVLAGQQITALQATSTTFENMDLRGIALQGALLRGCNFMKCRLSSADLRGSNFSNSLFDEADFSKSILMPLNFKKEGGANYHWPCNFTRAHLHNVIFTGAKLREAIFRDADLKGADFTHCDLRNADFTGADMTGTKFEGAYLAGTTGLPFSE